jgi:NADPH:quinone reductase-like Zn-dependent oxidoreductase
MKSWFHGSEANRAALELRDVPEPAPQAGEILVRVRAAALNRGEFLARQTLPATSPAKPAGIECAGEVVQLGAGVESFALGERVMGRAAMAFSEYAVLRVGDAIGVPQRLTWEAAAGASITYLVAYDMLWPGGALQTGEWLLITGASSGVGVASLQLGKLLGARVIGTSGSAEKLQRLQDLGLDFGLLCRNQGFEQRVMEVTGGLGVDLVVNNVGGSVFAECLRVLAYRGRLATVGHLDGEGRAEIDLLAQHAKRLHLFGVSNKLRSAGEVAECVAGFKRDVLPAIAEGRVRPVVDRVYAFADLPLALARMEANSHVGKIVINL